MKEKTRLVALFALSSLLCVACGGGQQSGAETPDDAAVTDDSAVTEGAGSETGSETGPEPGPGDGIVRDADGDGVPDHEQSAGCEGKNETQCKINSACAWSDGGKCVEAGGG